MIKQRLPVRTALVVALIPKAGVAPAVNGMKERRSTIYMTPKP
jgi:hypothetical protein